MRLAWLALGFLASFSTTACTVTSVGTSDPESEPVSLPATSTPSESENTTPRKDPPTLAGPTDDTTFAEVVYVFMRDHEHDLWFCTGTLVAKDKVVTAAHCLETKEFVSYEIVAPLAPGKPRVTATNPKSFGGDYEVVENPDIGFLTLTTPIHLPQYATLTDVVARVEANEPLTGGAVVRTDKLPESPLTMSEQLPLSSTVDLGYTHGFGTPYFSKGGDSGAGLFLVENGKLTHKLIGVARQPEPDRDLDHFTRIDASFLAWYTTSSPSQ